MKVDTALLKEKDKALADPLKFTIALKNYHKYTGGNEGSHGKKSELDEAFVRAVEYEYGVKCLEHLGVEASQRNVKEVLQKTPLKDRLVLPAHEGSAESAIAFDIFPSVKDCSKKLPHSGKSKDEEKGREKKSVKEIRTKLPQINERYIESKYKKAKEASEITTGMIKLTIENIKKRYLYPFGVDSKSLLNAIVIKLKELGNNVDLVKSTAMELPSNCIAANKKEIVAELQKPITVLLITYIVAKGRRDIERAKEF